MDTTYDALGRVYSVSKSVSSRRDGLLDDNFVRCTRAGDRSEDVGRQGRRHNPADDARKFVESKRLSTGRRDSLQEIFLPRKRRESL